MKGEGKGGRTERRRGKDKGEGKEGESKWNGRDNVAQG